MLFQITKVSCILCCLISLVPSMPSNVNLLSRTRTCKRPGVPSFFVLLTALPRPPASNWSRENMLWVGIGAARLLWGLGDCSVGGKPVRRFPIMYTARRDFSKPRKVGIPRLAASDLGSGIPIILDSGMPLVLQNCTCFLYYYVTNASFTFYEPLSLLHA